MNHWDRLTFSYCFQFQKLAENPHLQILEKLCCVFSMKHCFVLYYLVSLLLKPKPTVSFPLASIGFSIGPSAANQLGLHSIIQQYYSLNENVAIRC